MPHLSTRLAALWPLALACAPRPADLAAVPASFPGTAHPMLAGEPSGQPVELGRVRWERDHDAAFARAEREDRPVLLLFQEVPG